MLTRARRQYPDELRERAIRMVFEQWKAIVSIAEKVDVHRETLRMRVRRAEVDDGRRPGPTTGERARMKDLERENKELPRANSFRGAREREASSVELAAELLSGRD